MNEAEDQEEIPIAQLSGAVVSHIANDWAGYDQSPATGSSLATPMSIRKQAKVSGYTAPDYRPGPVESSPQVYQPESSVTPRRYIKVQMPSEGSPCPRTTYEAVSGVYQGPPLSSEPALSPLSDPLASTSHNLFPNNREQVDERQYQTLPTPPGSRQQTSYSSDFHLPAPQASSSFGNQLTLPSFDSTATGFSSSRQSSISGEPSFQWLPEEDRLGDTFRVPSFADAGRVLSGISSNGAFANKDTPYQYRDFSFSSLMSRSASIATTTSAERDREGK